MPGTSGTSDLTKTYAIASSQSCARSAGLLRSSHLSEWCAETSAHVTSARAPPGLLVTFAQYLQDFCLDLQDFCPCTSGTSCNFCPVPPGLLPGSPELLPGISGASRPAQHLWGLWQSHSVVSWASHLSEWCAHASAHVTSARGWISGTSCDFCPCTSRTSDLPGITKTYAIASSPGLLPAQLGFSGLLRVVCTYISSCNFCPRPSGTSTL